MIVSEDFFRGGFNNESLAAVFSRLSRISFSRTSFNKVSSSVSDNISVYCFRLNSSVKVSKLNKKKKVEHYHEAHSKILMHTNISNVVRVLEQHEQVLAFPYYEELFQQNHVQV